MFLSSSHSVFLPFAMKNRKQMSIQDACLKCWTPNLESIVVGTQTWTCHLPAKHHRFTGCSEMDLALFQNHAVALNSLPHQVPVKDLNTYAFVQSRPSDRERGAWLHPTFPNSFHWKQGWDRLLCCDPLEYYRAWLIPKSKWLKGGISSASDIITEPKKSFDKKQSPIVSGAVQIRGTASAKESQQSQQMKQTRATRRNNSIRVSNVLRVAVEKLDTEPRCPGSQPYAYSTTSLCQAHRCCSFKPISLHVRCYLN